ncbi:MAG: division/cell wall cluster transcriptional repressor MraZ [Bacillota bacterium]|nr:division/cell wall cluster transcriptional repressor MraZ [Bacillota bacterium]
MLFGEVNHSIDAKGRYIVPAAFRESLGERFMITKGFDRSLYVYPMASWEKVVDNMSQLPSNDARARRFAHSLFSGAFEAEIDKQFRVLIPQILRSYSEIEKEIVSVGMSTRLEIWAKEKWEAYRDDSADSYEEDASFFPGVII